MGILERPERERETEKLRKESREGRSEEGLRKGKMEGRERRRK